MNMEEKKADNSIINKTNAQLDIIDNSIDESKRVLKKLDSFEETFVSLNKNINKCVDLLNTSIKGKKATVVLDSIVEDSKINHKQTLSIIDEDRQKEKKALSNLYDKKDELNKKIKAEYEKQKALEEQEKKKANVVEKKEE